MRAIWYGDRRDRVKWGALLHLSKIYRMPLIIQIAYLRDGVRRGLHLEGTRKTEISSAVWEHFSDLRIIRRLGRLTHTRIVVFDTEFDSTAREKYLEEVLTEIRRHSARKICFLDPDTGLQPGRRASGAHVRIDEVSAVWASLDPRDILAIYQHADRSGRWLKRSLEQLRRVCRSRVHWITGPAIANDVAIIWSLKERS